MTRKTTAFVRTLFFCLCSVALTACSLFGQKESLQPATPSLTPVFTVSENYYLSTVPYKPNNTRGMLAEQSYRIDFSHLEFGMMEIAKETFAPEQYFFQEGRQISREQVEAWLSRTKQHPEGLNSEKGKRVLINILEHDYLDKEKKTLAGMVIGISLSPIYNDASGQELQYSKDELRAKGQQIAARIVQKVRAQNVQIPMVIALYQVPERASTLVPGHFIMTGTVSSAESTVSQWQPIEEEYYLFPGEDVYRKYPQISIQYEKLMKQTQSFFGMYIGLTGLGRFMDGELTELTITATAEYDSRSEVLQFTQYTAGLLHQLFDPNIHINLYVQSINNPLAIYVRPVDREPYMHMYRK